MADDYAWDTDHFIVCNGNAGSPRNFTDLNTWAQGEGGAAAAAITEIVAGAMYLIEAEIEFGNGSDSTYFTSLNEMIYFADGETFDIKALATLQLGALQDSFGINGSVWSVGQAGTWNLIGYVAGTFLGYGSRLHIRTNQIVYFRAGSITLNKFTFSSNAVAAGRWVIFDPAVAYLSLVSVYANHLWGLMFKVTPDAIQNVHVHYSDTALAVRGTTLIDLVEITAAASFDVQSPSGTTNHITIRDPVNAIGIVTILAADGWIVEQYTCNIHVVDKDNNDLEDVTITCTDSQPVEEFSVDTDAGGDIAEQTIDFKTWAGTDETLTSHSPHVFTFVKDGYKTLTIPAYTVDHKLIWELKLLDAGALSNYAENEVLDHITGKTAFPKPTIYVGLCTSDPGDAATGASCNELPDADNYARVAIPSGDWNAAASGEITNANAITFLEASGNWGEVTHYVILDSGTHGAGNVIVYDRLDAMIDIRDEEVVRFVAGDLKLTLD